MTTEFNLSEKAFISVRFPKADERIFREKDVKEFIRLLKEENCFCWAFNDDYITPKVLCFFCESLNKLAGDKLI
jgi:hypothetical protein